MMKTMQIINDKEPQFVMEVTTDIMCMEFCFRSKSGAILSGSIDIKKNTIESTNYIFFKHATHADQIYFTLTDNRNIFIISNCDGDLQLVSNSAKLKQSKKGDDDAKN